MALEYSNNGETFSDQEILDLPRCLAEPDSLSIIELYDLPEKFRGRSRTFVNEAIKAFCNDLDGAALIVSRAKFLTFMQSYFESQKSSDVLGLNIQFIKNKAGRLLADAAEARAEKLVDISAVRPAFAPSKRDEMMWSLFQTGYPALVLPVMVNMMAVDIKAASIKGLINLAVSNGALLSSTFIARAYYKKYRTPKAKQLLLSSACVLSILGTQGYLAHKFGDEEICREGNRVIAKLVDLKTHAQDYIGNDRKRLPVKSLAQDMQSIVKWDADLVANSLTDAPVPVFAPRDTTAVKNYCNQRIINFYRRTAAENLQFSKPSKLLVEQAQTELNLATTLQRRVAPSP